MYLCVLHYVIYYLHTLPVGIMYNLRSAKNNTFELPVEIQLTGDKTFIETVLKNNTTVSDIENSMSDSDTSSSDLDCSGLMNGSDQVPLQ